MSNNASPKLKAFVNILNIHSKINELLFFSLEIEKAETLFECSPNRLTRLV